MSGRALRNTLFVTFVALVSALAITGCRATSGTISVRLLSDFVVGVEVVRARTTVTPREGTSGMPRRVTSALPTVPLTSEHVVAELGGLPVGQYDVAVELLTETSLVVETRHVLLHLPAGTTPVRVSMARSCVSIQCPTLDDPGATECVAGHCVAPTCTGLTCPGSPECVDASDCVAPDASCAEAACVEGLCLAREIPGACAADEVCHPDDGCAPITMHDPGECAPGDPTCCDPLFDVQCCNPEVAPACCPPGACCDPRDRDCDGAVGTDDPAPDDPAVYVGAPEVCGDGVDQNGDGVDLACPSCVDADGDGCCAGDPDHDVDDADATRCEDVGDGGPDADGDGFSDAEEAAAGCPVGAAQSAQIGPQAYEICGNGIDEDCDGHDTPLSQCAGHYTQPCGLHGYCTDSSRQHLACTTASGAFERSCLRCCVICEAQSRFHWVNVDADCAGAAERYCARSSRGGLATAPGIDPVQWGTCAR